LLEAREEAWRLKSREIWLQAGDDNTKKNNNFPRVENVLTPFCHWKTKLEWDLARDFSQYFRTLFSAPRNTTFSKIIQIAYLFPSFLNEENNNDLMSPVTSGELEAILQWLKKDKILGP